MKLLSVLAVILLSCAMFLCMFSSVAVLPVNASTHSEMELQAQTILTEFVTTHPNRVSDKVGEYNAGVYINDYFNAIGIASAMHKITGQKVSNNVIATMDNANTNDTIVIGAHYDAVGEGAQDNATGVTALLMIAQQLYDNQDTLGCDIVLVAFGSEELGLVGSYDYVNSLSLADKNNTKLMINMDSIGGGDNLYVYGENKSTKFVDTLISNSSGILQQKPLSKGIHYDMDHYGYGYYHVAQSSDHTPFRLSMIPTAFYYGGTYDNFGGVYKESNDVDKQVMNTPNDTLSNLTDNGSSIEYARRIVTVVNSVVGSITDETSLDILLDSPNQLVSDVWYNGMYASIGIVVITIILLILSRIHAKKLTKQSIMGVADIKTSNIFTQPDVDDIFDFGDKK